MLRVLAGVALIPTILFVGTITLSFLSTSVAYAAINNQISFQGKLTNPDGTNVTTGNYSIRFRLYNDPSLDAANACAANSCKWEETQAAVSVTDGIFQVYLGSGTALPGSVDFNSGSIYLGIKVGADAEMTPRILFTASPYAFNSDKLGGLASDGFVQLAQGFQTDSSTTNASVAINKTGITAKIVDLQRDGVSVFNINNDGSTLHKSATGADSATAFQVQSSTSVPLLTIDSVAGQVIVGSATTDTTQELLQLDSFDTFADTASCTTVANQGGIYYNTQSNSVRACVNGVWEDLASTGGLGLQLFGVVPDSGANPGDLAAVTGAQNGPCKVSVGANTTTVSWKACTAYSGGRKVIVAAGTATTTNAVAGRFQHLCLTGANGQPALSASGTEVANLATVSFPSATSPILCLADIRFAAANNTITQIYDTRTYTTTDKITVSSNSAAALGFIMQFVATKGVVQTVGVVNSNNIAGVVVASTGTASAVAVNTILAINGPAAVKAITGGSDAVNAYIFTSATAGYARGNATKPAEGTGTIYNVLGNARTAWTGAAACTANNDTCAGSFLTFIDKR